MQRSILHTVVLSFLLLVFLTFTIGIPVVRTLCPLMKDGHCAMEPSGLVVSLPLPDCCHSSILAERNMNPFLQLEQIAVSLFLFLTMLFLTPFGNFLSNQSAIRFRFVEALSPVNPKTPLFSILRI
jgi:hypothetical protein